MKHSIGRDANLRDGPKVKGLEKIHSPSFARLRLSGCMDKQTKKTASHKFAVDRFNFSPRVADKDTPNA